MFTDDMPTVDGRLRRTQGWLRPRLHTRWFPWAALAIAAVLAVPVSLLVILATWLQHRDLPPPCYGLGWGCTLDPQSYGLVIGALWLYACGIVAIPMAISELFWRRVALVRSVVCLALLLVAMGAVLLACAAVVLNAVT